MEKARMHTTKKSLVGVEVPYAKMPQSITILSILALAACSAIPQNPTHCSYKQKMCHTLIFLLLALRRAFGFPPAFSGIEYSNGITHSQCFRDRHRATLAHFGCGGRTDRRSHWWAGSGSLPTEMIHGSSELEESLWFGGKTIYSTSS